MSKKITTKNKSSSKKKVQKNWLSSYFKQRDQFFHDHQNARILLGLFLVGFAFYLANMISNYKKELFIGRELDAYGIDAVKVNALEK